MKDLTVEIDGFPPGSLIWVKCSNEKSVKEVTKAVEELGLTEYSFVVTGPRTSLTQLSRESLVDALKMIHRLKTPDGALPN